MLLGPQGDGWHGSTGTGTIFRYIKKSSPDVEYRIKRNFFIKIVSFNKTMTF